MTELHSKGQPLAPSKNKQAKDDSFHPRIAHPWRFIGSGDAVGLVRSFLLFPAQASRDFLHLGPNARLNVTQAVEGQSLPHLLQTPLSSTVVSVPWQQYSVALAFARPGTHSDTLLLHTLPR